jgi:DNA replication protein DnaC
MERHDVMDLMGQLKLAGMRAAYDEIVGAGVKRKHAIGRIVGDLLAAEVADKTARSIRYRLSAAKLPMAKDLSDFDFKASPVNEALVRELHDGGFVHSLRNAVLVGGTGTGKTHLAMVRRAGSPTSSRGSICWSSTNSVTCPSPKVAGSYYSILSAGSTNEPR